MSNATNNANANASSNTAVHTVNLGGNTTLHSGLNVGGTSTTLNASTFVPRYTGLTGVGLGLNRASVLRSSHTATVRMASPPPLLPRVTPALTSVAMAPRVTPVVHNSV